jgi:ABC-type amino acid transport substrate-binding protein
VKRLNAVVYAFDRIEDAYKWLQNGRVDAVVYDQPQLLYYAQNRGKGLVEVVGRTFEPQDYAMATRQGSELREELNRIILAMIEDGTYEEIWEKWFGVEE